MSAVGDSKDARPSRVGPWMGIAFFVLFVGGFVAFTTPEDNKKTAEWTRWWNDSGHRTTAVIAAYLMVLGLLAFVWFAWNLRERVGRGGGLMFVFGSLFAAVGLISTMVRATIPGSKLFGNTPVPPGDFSRQFDQIGFATLLIAGALSAGLFIGIASYEARKAGILPGWLTIAGYVIAVLQLAGALFFPFALFPLWVLIASIVLVRRGGKVVTLDESIGTTTRATASTAPSG
jgi:hypothetical protein